jgi:hypothetical protein
MSSDNDLFSRESKLAVVRESKSVIVRERNLSTRARESNLVAIRESNRESRRVHFAQKKKIVSESEKFIIVTFSKRRRTKTHYLSFIIICFSKSLDTIQSFREVRRQERLILRNFYHMHQNLLAARLEDSDQNESYLSSSSKTENFVIVNHSSQEFSLDSISDTDLFDLEVRSSFHFFSLKHVNINQLFAHSSSSQHVELALDEEHDQRCRNRQAEKRVEISNVSLRDEKLADSDESLKLRRERLFDEHLDRQHRD